MKYVAAVLAGFLVFAMLMPAGGAGFRCYSFFAIEVPCEGWLAIAAALATVGLLAGAIWQAGRRSRNG